MIDVQEVIPSVWAKIPLIDCFENSIGGANILSTEYSSSGNPVILKSDVQPMCQTIYPTKFISEKIVKNKYENRTVKINDLLLCMRDLSQKANILGLITASEDRQIDSLVAQGVTILRGCKINGKFISYFSNVYSYRKYIQGAKRGSTQVHLGNDDVFEIALPLPPLEEQNRIIQKIESCFEKIDTTEANLNNVETLLEKYRESLLAKAFRGELVPQDPSDEPASVLLEKIRREIGTDEAGEFYQLKEEDIPYELPDDWAWCTLPEVGVLARGKSKHRPRNDKKLFGGKYPFIQTGDISNADMYLREHEQTYNDFGLAQSRLFPEGTLCITIAANIGETAILTYPACFPDSIVGYTPHKGYLTSEFVLFFFEFIQNNLERIAPGAAQKNINLEILSKIPFPLPPLRVQNEIERIINQFYKLLGSEKDSIKSKQDLIRKLKDSVLAKAFQGQLVEQIPSEGTGHDLLAKILSEKEASQKPELKEKIKKTPAKKAVKGKQNGKK